MDEPCDLPLCADPGSHTAGAHVCEFCGRSGHGIGACPRLPGRIPCENSGMPTADFAAEARLKFAGRRGSGAAYACLSAGMGCALYVRGTGPHDLRAFLLEEDRQGQYGPDDRPDLAQFLRGASPLEREDRLEALVPCPICRQPSGYRPVFLAGGAPECMVCMERGVEVAMEACGHAVMCGECAQLLEAFQNDVVQ